MICHLQRRFLRSRRRPHRPGARDRRRGLCRGRRVRRRAATATPRCGAPRSPAVPTSRWSSSPAWMTDRVVRAAADATALIGISSGSNQEVYEGLDLARVGRARHAEAEREWLKAVTNREISWALIALPDRALGAGGAWRARRRAAVGGRRAALRLDEPDPAAAVGQRPERARRQRTQMLDERAFKTPALPRPRAPTSASR